MTKVISGSIGAGFISGNTTTMTFNAPVDVLKVNSLKLNNVTKLSKCGYNGFLMIHNGKVYTCAGNQGTYSSLTIGRGNQYPVQMGYDSLRVVNFPGETGTLVDANSNAYDCAYALFSTGNLYTWGYNAQGQCGVGHTSAVYIPTLAATGVTNVYVHPSNGDYSIATKTIIRKTDGYLYAAGYNGNGQLGVGDTTNRSSFTQITSLGNGTFLSVWNLGADYGCLVVQKSDYTIWVAGYNGYGQLGLNDTTLRSTPVDATTPWGGGSNKLLTKVLHGGGYHTGSGASSNTWLAMLIDDGTTNFLRTAGCSSEGTIGNGGTSNYYTPQSPNYGTGRIADVASTGGGLGTIHLLKTDGTLWGWGRNGYGQVGNGNTTQQNSPVLIGGGFAALLSDGYSNHIQGYVTASYVRKTDGALYAAGYNGLGGLGVGDQSDRSSFTRVLLPPDFITVDMGWYQSTYPGGIMIALSSDNRLYAWGYNGQYGISGEGYNQNVTVPVQIRLPLGA